MSKLLEEPIWCDRHGERRGTVMCRHLLNYTAKAVFTPLDEPDPSNPTPEAWCEECEQVLAEQGEWNEVASDFAYFQLICDRCYYDVKRRALIRLCEMPN